VPIYEYRCENCGDILERMMPISEMKDEVICEWCGGKARRIMSAPNFHLIGSDWYKPVAKEPAAKPVSDTSGGS
jgi:putative FmdB family regulatory protein